MLQASSSRGSSCLRPEWGSAASTSSTSTSTSTSTSSRRGWPCSRRCACRAAAQPGPAPPALLGEDTTPVLGPRTTRPQAPTYAKPPITGTGTLMPSAEWYPAWMKYRKREDNHVFWTDKFNRNSLDVMPVEKRWTLFSTFWYLVMQFRFYAVPPAFRFFIAMGWRRLMFAAYGLHKALVLWQCKVDAWLAGQGASRTSTSPPSPASAPATSTPAASSGPSTSTPSSPSRQGSAGQAGTSSSAPPAPAFSRTMALRRLHWQNSLLGEVMYMVNLFKTGRVRLLPPVKKPAQRPTFFWLF